MAEPINTRKDAYDTRYYQCALCGSEHKSSTSWLGGGFPKPALINWAKKITAITAFEEKEEWLDMERDDAIDFLKKRPDELRDKAGAKGTDIHEWAQNVILNVYGSREAALDVLPDEQKNYGVAFNVYGSREAALDVLPDEQKNYGVAFFKFIDEKKPEFEAVEASVFNCEYDYAGTLDFIAMIQFIEEIEMTMVDIKTGSGIYADFPLQLASYRYAKKLRISDAEFIDMPQVQKTAILHLRDDGEYRLVYLEAGKAEFQKFLNVKEIAKHISDFDKEIRKLKKVGKV